MFYFQLNLSMNRTIFLLPAEPRVEILRNSVVCIARVH
jgi:hypothetical protein